MKDQSEDVPEATIEVGNAKVRFSSGELEQQVDEFFETIIAEFFLPTMERLHEKGLDAGRLSEQFWDEVFQKIGAMAGDLGAGERKLLLRLLVSVEARRRFLGMIE